MQNKARGRRSHDEEQEGAWGRQSERDGEEISSSSGETGAAIAAPG